MIGCGEVSRCGGGCIMQVYAVVVDACNLCGPNCSIIIFA